jgi:uncharacterized peroxidase-related enzyme
VAFVDPVPRDGAEGAAAELYRDELERAGHISNYVEAFSLRPDIYAAWRGLVGAVTANMDPRRYELVTLAAARALRSSYCMLAHGKVLTDRFMSPEELVAVAADHRSAPLDEVDVAVMDLAEQVVRDATAITPEQIQRLRDVSLTDGEIFDVVAAATARCFFSKTLDALGVRPDANYAEVEPELREALVVGRPIAEA